VHFATAYPGATDTDMMSTKDAGEDLGFGRRPVDDVTAEIIAGLEADESAINTSLPSRRGKQELNARDPKAVTVAISAKLTQLEAATRRHRSM